MRKETLKIATAFLRGEPAHAARTSTDGENVLLHGHCIAWKGGNDDVQFSFRNWPTVTTRERINGVLDVLGYSCWRIATRGRTMACSQCKENQKTSDNGNRILHG